MPNSLLMKGTFLGRECMNVREKIARVKRFLGISWPYLLSHHPHCRTFQDDVLHLGQIRLCAGCFIAYPTALIVISYSLLTDLAFLYPWYYYILPGFFLGSFQLLSLFGKGERFRHLIKFTLGLGIGLTTIGVFRTGLHICLSLYIFYMLVMFSGMLVNLRARKIEKICEKCRYKKDWYHCPGFGKLHQDLGREGFL